MPYAGQLDAPALERLYIRLEKPLYNVVYRWVWDAGEATDIVQETFVRLWSMRGRVRLETVDSLAYKIALNLASKRKRAQKTWGWTPFEGWMGRSNLAGADEALAANERERAVRAAVDALPDHLRAVVMLCTYSDMSYGEVALALDIPAGTVGSRKNKAVEQLRAALEEQEWPL